MELVKSLFFGADAIPGSEPGTAGSGSGIGMTYTPTRKTKTYFMKLTLFAFLWIVFPLSLLLLGLPAVPVLWINHTYYRKYMRQLEKGLGALTVMTAYLFMPGTSLVLSGDFDKMKQTDKMVVMANHQIYPDWLYLICCAWAKNLHGDFRIMMIKVLNMIPIYGQVMQMFEFIYLNQKLEKDRPIIHKNLTLAKKEKDIPLWMLIFPEGTLNTPGNVKKSETYAEKMSISPHPRHCLLPKSAGLFYTIQDLQPSAPSLFDLTIGYTGVAASEVPFEVLLPDRVLLGNQYPQQVHIHCRQFEVSQIPGFGESAVSSPEAERKVRLDAWLRQVWMEKDERLSRFYNRGTLVDADKDKGRVSHVPIIPRNEDFLYLFMLLLGLWMVFPLYWAVVWWCLVSVVRVLWTILWVALKVVGFSRLFLWGGMILFLDGLVKKSG
ncbi:hypothetical protein HDU98_000963 [Podochytrium sp. JEL0797]|nr:hypothetical protein HDU98_000963 [Podochytrium sp. JEL0797]